MSTSRIVDKEKASLLRFGKKMVRADRVESGSEDLSEDLLDGADEIAEYTGWSRRRVFYLLEKGLIPAFKVGKRWTARKSRLRRHIEELEGGE